MHPLRRAYTPSATRTRRCYGVAATALAVIGSLAASAPASAQETVEEPPVRCDIDSFGDVRLLDASVGYDPYPGVAIGQTDPIGLGAAVPAGRVVVTGISGDIVHIEDELNFETERSQFSERFAVEFLGADGGVVGTTTPTPDLPDLALIAPFALPSIDLSGEATQIRLVHVGDGLSPNSVLAPCINIDSVDSNTDLGSQVRPNICPVDLEIPADDLVCGFFAVPEERDDPDSRLIQVMFGLVEGSGEFDDPIFYLEGGPGGAPLTFSGAIIDAGFGEISGGRDMVFVDQRGTGYAEPNLLCPPTEDFENASRLCFEAKTAEGIRLSSYTSVENAQDVADLRIAIGYDEYNLYGGSYGTELGLTIMRDRPENIRSSVLDSVLPPVVNPIIDQGIGAVKALDAMVARCAADPECSEGIPDLQSDINTAFQNVAEQPVPLDEALMEVTGFESLGPDELMLVLQSFQDDPIIAAMSRGLADPDPEVRRVAFERQVEGFLANQIAELTEFLEGADGPPPDEVDPEVIQMMMRARFGVPGPGSAFADGFFLTVICAEEQPFVDLGGATSLDPENGWSDLVLAVALSIQVVDCNGFPVDAEADIVTEAVVSDILTLVLLSDTDSQTVPEWSRIAAETLSNGQLFEFPAVAHVVALSHPCPTAITAQFVADPGGVIDASCIDDMPAIDYESELPPSPGTIEELTAEFEALLELLFSEGPPLAEPPAEDAPTEQGEPDPAAA